jgi:hypothetical protein
MIHNVLMVEGKYFLSVNIKVIRIFGYLIKNWASISKRSVMVLKPISLGLST